MIASRFIDNGSIRTAYYDAGAGDAPLVLVHGFTGSKLDFHDQFAWFTGGRRVLAPDHRGHGESTNTGPYRLDQLRADLLGFLDTLGIERCHLLGHSMGGIIAMRMALSDPKRLASLILMDTSAEPLTIMPSRLLPQITQRGFGDGLAALVDWLKSAPRSASVQRGIDFLGEAEHWRRIQEKLGQMDPEAFVGLGNELVGCPGVLDRLRSLACPTTVMVGADDLPFIEPSARMAAAIPGGRLVTIPNAAHCPQYENADAWREAIATHLAFAA